MTTRSRSEHSENGIDKDNEDSDERISLADSDFGGSVATSVSSGSSNNEKDDLEMFSGNNFVSLDPQREAEEGIEEDNIIDTSIDGRTHRRAAKSDLERRKRNTEASARFRIKRRLKEHEMSERLSKMWSHISEMKIKVKTLEMENQCLKRMLLGDTGMAVPRDGVERSTRTGKALDKLSLSSLSNYELLNLIKQKTSESFKITSI
ncbi:hypothetical protein FOA43_002338 [Brettanomyces nanus]|uniref:BZIP domain-containing protein n=1 Tax=Eeniella nana TaxID=13502 RepID=A0A875S220_EENNA|nr:uncharacterized protein FOA43_002338 [Brettanomyces nanus]QPG74998.1 hypothetical protein FOA43_002338 [Brettanomyces nanus]